MSTQALGIDDEEFCMDTIPRVETSFGIRFQPNDLAHVRTFGDFCEVVLAKLSCSNVHDCTTQQAFYKLRKALNAQLPGVAIEPSTGLTVLLPAGRRQRRKTIEAVEAELGMKLNILGNDLATQLIGLLLLIGFGATIFFDKNIGGIGLICTLMYFFFATKLASIIQMENVRSVTEQMSSHYYRQSRRNPNSINRAEIVERMQHLFVHELGLELDSLKPKAALH